jgi:pyridinium-3,5-biscarboxylic acid mononucleotide synthase
MAARPTRKGDRGLDGAVEALRAGAIDAEEFVRRVAPYAVHEVGEVAKVDSGRHARTGVGEAVLAEGKDDATLAAVVRAAVKASGRCLVTRIRPSRGKRLRRALPGIVLDIHDREHAVVAHNGRARAPSSGGKVAILTAGSSDLRAAGEARLTAEEMGCKVYFFADVGVAGIHRLFPAVRKLEAEGVHAVIVAAGMDGALPSVVGGLVSVPTIGLPISTGYGVGGKGKAALLSILQSCAPGVAAVNVDNGYGAGVLAAKIANNAARAARGPSAPRKA